MLLTVKKLIEKKNIMAMHGKKHIQKYEVTNKRTNAV